nr:reverse transcriptase domain-containing protein [Tanacetum cinerariifolium]
MVKALLLDKKNRSPAPNPSTTPVPVKAVEPNCVTCGGAHSYQNCPATHENAYRDNIQEYVSQAAAAKYNQGNTGFRPQMVANQIRPPGFPPHQNNQNNFNRGNNFNQNRGGNFNQSNFNPSSFNQDQLYRPQVNQAPVYQAPIPQTQRVSQTDFESYVKANDAILRNMQSQGQSTQNQCQNIQNQYQNLQIQMATLTDMMSKFVSANTASSSGSGTLPGNTITNPKKELNGITTRSGVAYQGPKTPSRSKQGTKYQTVQNQLANLMDMMSKFMSSNMASSSGSGTLPGNTVTNPKEDLKGITTRSGVAYNGPTILTPSKDVKQGTEVTKDQVQTPSPQSTAQVQPPVTQSETPVSEPIAALVNAPMPNLKPSIPYPSRRDNEKRRMDECLALADLGASINLMPLSVWKELSLPELTPICMTLKLADRSVSKPIGIAKDVKVKVGMFHFTADFVVVDFEPDPQVLLILRRYSTNYDQMTENKIDVTDEACEEYFQEVLDFSDVTTSRSPTPSNDPIVSTTSPTLTLFGDSDFLLFEEANAFLGLEDDPDLPELAPSYYDPEGDFQMLEAILNSDPVPSLPNHEQYVPWFTNELKACEAKTIKSSVDEPPEVELKDVPPHLEYAFLESNNKLPVVIAKELGEEEKAALIKVLKSHKLAIAWKLSDIQGINPEFYTHKILIEKDYKPTIQHQRQVNPKIHDVIKKEVKNFLTLD